MDSSVGPLLLSLDSNLYLGVDEKVMNRFNCEAAIKWIIVFALVVFFGGGSDHLSVLPYLWMTLIEIGLIGVI
jgi:hypothetical protein